jgi:two-component sensor histidine kinase
VKSPFFELHKTKESTAFLFETVPTAGKRSRLALARFPIALPIGVFLLIALADLLSVFAIERNAKAEEMSIMTRIAVAKGAALERKAAINASFLKAGAPLFALKDEVDSPFFHQFADDLLLDQNYRNLAGIGWAPVLKADQVPAFNRAISLEYGRELKVVQDSEASPLAALAPTKYFLPETRYSDATVGFDLYSDDLKREAMEHAARSAQPAATGLLTVQSQDGSDMAAFQIYMPVFQRTGNTRALSGFIYSEFAAQDFFDAARKLIDAGVRSSINDYGIELYDGSASRNALLASQAGGNSASFVVEQDLRLADRAMTLVVRSSGQMGLSTISWISLAFGLAIAGLVGVVARLLALQAIEDQRVLELHAEQNSIREGLLRELNHRVKNTLANVVSIIALTRQRSDSVETFADSLEGRVRALSATHDLLTDSEWGMIALEDVVSAELAPYAQGHESQLVISGPALALAPKDALALGMALHELATNASKFGALSNEAGVVAISWSMLEFDRAEIRWVESGGPVITQEPKAGFGVELIEKITAHELSNPVQLRFASEGVQCTFVVPLREAGEFAIRAER